MSSQNTVKSVGRVLRFARRHWPVILLALGSMIGYAGAEAFYLLKVAPIAVNVWGLMMGKEFHVQVDIAKLYEGAYIVLLLTPVIAALAFIQLYVPQRVVWQVVADIRNAICRALMPQSLSFFEGKRSGDLMSRITNDVGRSEGALKQMFSGLPEQCCKIVMGLGLAAYASWQLLLIIALTFPLIIYPVGTMARRIRRYGREGLERLADLTDLMSQMFSGIRVIKAFKMEDAETQEFERTNSKFFRKMRKMAYMRGLSAGVIELVIRGSLGAGIIVSIWLLMDKRIDLTPERLICFLGGTYYAFEGMRKLVKAYNELQEAVPAVDRIFELLNQPPSLQDAPDAAKLTHIEKGVAFKNVSFGYNRELVLRDVSFEVRRGQTIAVTGRSGGGKSTLVALLMRFYDVMEGEVMVDGIDVRRITRDSLLDRIAIVTQQTFLFNRSIAENIRYGKRDATMEEVEAAAKAANIRDFIMTLPAGYDTLCGEFGGKLSGGQRQRIAIARAVLKNADLLVLDEAMVGLDAESESLVREALANLMKGRTTFVITHDLATIQHADKILVLKDGRLIAHGTHDQLMAQEGEYRTLYAMQFASLSPS